MTEGGHPGVLNRSWRSWSRWCVLRHAGPAVNGCGWKTGVEQRGAVDQLRDVLAEPVGLEDLDVWPERQYLNRRAFEGMETERRLEPPMPVRRHVTFHAKGLEASEQRSRPPAFG